MALSRRRNDHMSAGAWPGYVDVLSTLLMVIVFVLAVFMLVQFFLANAISGRDKAIEGLRSELAGLIDQLNLEKRNNAQLRLDLRAILQHDAHVRRQRDLPAAAHRLVLQIRADGGGELLEDA